MDVYPKQGDVLPRLRFLILRRRASGELMMWEYHHKNNTAADTPEVMNVELVLGSQSIG